MKTKHTARFGFSRHSKKVCISIENTLSQIYYWGSPGGSDGKEAAWGDPGSSSGLGSSLRRENVIIIQSYNTKPRKQKCYYYFLMQNSVTTEALIFLT